MNAAEIERSLDLVATRVSDTRWVRYHSYGMREEIVPVGGSLLRVDLYRYGNSIGSVVDAPTYFRNLANRGGSKQ